MTGLLKIGKKMRNILFFIPLLFLCMCSGCSDDKNGDSARAEKQTSRQIPQREKQQEAQPKSEDSVKERKQAALPIKIDSGARPEASTSMSKAEADRIMAFCNASQQSLDAHWHKTAEMYYNLGHIYLRVFNLPANVRQPKRRRADLVPGKGLFSEKETRDLTRAMDDMDKALASMLTHYRNLEKYVANPEIVDNGKLGRKIVAELEQDHKAYTRAGRIWLGIVNEKARQAEEVLLADHPLARQALCGSRIMGLIAEIKNMLGEKTIKRQQLADISTRLGQLLALAEKPPFPAAPNLERLYRIFLKNAAVYNDVLKRASLEGVFEVQRNELSLAAKVCNETYNDFIESFNKTI